MEKVMIVIPGYNEQGSIGKVVKSIAPRLEVEGRTFTVEVVVVDDGSRDSTAVEAEAAGATVLRHVVNSGAGAATRTGLRYAQLHQQGLAYVVTIDGDGQHSTEDIERMVSYAVTHKSHMIVGNRLHAANKANIPAHRKFGNWGLNMVSRVLFNIKTKDTQTGLRLFSADTLSKVSYYTLDRYGFCTEMLWHALRSGIRVDEVPIAVSYSKESMAHGQNAWGGIELVRDLIWIRMVG